MEWFIVTAILIAVHIIYLKREKVSGYIARNRNISGVVTVDKNWDEEWLTAEKRRHNIAKIKPTNLYLFGDTSRSPLEGYRWYCECGKTTTATHLSMVDYGFKKHVSEEHDKALAAINRTK